KVIVVQHNLEVIKTADWVNDLGPEGGAGGGRIIDEGTPEEVAAVEESYTGRALRSVLGREGVGSRFSADSNGHPHADVDSGRKLTSDPIRPATSIKLRGASQHNLKNLDLEIQRDQITVFCGPSGSGKSSL